MTQDVVDWKLYFDTITILESCQLSILCLEVYLTWHKMSFRANLHNLQDVDVIAECSLAHLEITLAKLASRKFLLLQV